MLCLALYVSCFLFFPRFSEKAKRRTLIWVASLLVADEFFKVIPCLITGQYEAAFLPLHLCSVNILVIIWNTVRENDLAKGILSCVCVPATICALVSPSWVTLPFWNFMHIHSLLAHILLILYPVLLVADGYRPKVRQLGSFAVYLLSLMAFDKIINRILGTNFLFLEHNSNNPFLVVLEKITGKTFYDLGIFIFLMLITLLFMGIWRIIEGKEK